MTATVTIVTQAADNAIEVPNSAISWAQSQPATQTQSSQSTGAPAGVQTGAGQQGGGAPAGGQAGAGQQAGGAPAGGQPGAGQRQRSGQAPSGQAPSGQAADPA